MGKLSLWYFPVKSRGESLRLALDYCGIDFEDKTIEKSYFMEHTKESLPFKQLPVLVLEDGTFVAHSNAILMHIGKMGGIYSDDLTEMTITNQVLMQCEDMIVIVFRYGYCRPEDKIFMFEHLKSTIPKMMDDLAKFIEKNATTGYCVKNKVSIADFQLHLILQLLKDYGVYDNIINGMTYNSEPITSVYKNIMSQPSLKKRTSTYIQ